MSTTPESTDEVTVTLLRSHRLRRGMTQVQLALASGYSERVIRKAEAGGRVRGETLAVLAEALSTPAHPLTLADLRGDPLAVARAADELHDVHGFAAAPRLAHLLDDAFELQVHAEQADLPVGGTWHGVDGLDALLQRVATLCRSIRYEPPRHFVAEGRVITQRHAIIRPLNGTEPLRTWMIAEREIVAGRITRTDLYVDTLALRRFFDA